MMQIKQVQELSDNNRWLKKECSLSALAACVCVCITGLSGDRALKVSLHGLP